MKCWPQGTDKTAPVYGWHCKTRKYAAGFDSDGLIGRGSGRPPINPFLPATAHYWVCGASAAHSMRAHPGETSLKWRTAMIRLKYARKGNSGYD